jgi:SAM-dependent methyltransferase
VVVMKSEWALNTDPKAGEVLRHFDESAAAFDSIYTGRKGTLARWLDRALRWDMFARLDATIREVLDMGQPTVLDIGCGSGIFSVALARQGVKRVVGIDFAPRMIELATARAAAAGLTDGCEFMVGDFRRMTFGERFDCSIAIGVFDYLAAPAPFLEAMMKVTSGKIVATFPCRWTYRAPIRKLRLSFYGCPVYFYSASDVKRLFTAVGVSRVRIRRIGKIFLAVADLGERGQHSPASGQA